MKLYKIADLNVLLECRYDILKNMASAYEASDSGVVDIAISIGDELIDSHIKDYQGLERGEIEYLFSGFDFCTKLISWGGVCIHSSAVVYGGKAYLFSAPQGTGKSTHTAMWKKIFNDNACIINDDKPAVRIINGVAYAYGTPWCGKEYINANIKAPIAGICYIHQSKENIIERMDNKMAAVRLMEQTLKANDKKSIVSVLNIIDKLIKIVPIYSMGCNISEEAVYTALNKMKY